MPDLPLTRRGPLAAPAAAGSDEGPVSVRLLPPATRFSLRLGADALAGRPAAAGFRLDQPVNRFAEDGRRLSARLGPDEWLLIAEGEEAEELARAIAAALAGTHHALVDVSHRQAALGISGARTPDVLNAGCALDLAAGRFPTGMATRTLIGKAEVVLLRTGDRPIYRVECWRSFARYLDAFIAEAAAEHIG